MKWRQLWIIGLSLVLALAFAQTRGAVKLDLQAYRVLSVQENGRSVEKLEEALEVRPGQLIEYRLAAQNTSQTALRQVSLVIPIPRTTAYQALSAAPLRLGQSLVAPQFSFDGGSVYGFPPLKRKVTVMENGKEVQREVEVKPEEYTHVRWVLPQMATQENVVLTLRATVR
ncbi:MAG: hypothetical protein SFU83_05290 [Meiothermus sp.]|nr:hypothetical protein [Meiothermus sp.]